MSFRYWIDILIPLLDKAIDWLETMKKRRKRRPGGYGSGAFYEVRHRGNLVRLHSGWELKTYRYMRRRRWNFEPQPKPPLPYLDSDGKRRTYTPDFLVRERNGDSYFIEIKPKRFYTERVKNKLNRASKLNNVRIVVWTEIELRNRGIL